MRTQQFKWVMTLLISFSSGLLFAQIQQVFNYTGTIETWIVPAGVNQVTIECRGAEGGISPLSNITPGLGAIMIGDFTVSPGQQLKILVGQQPIGIVGVQDGNGGGGGSFVTDNQNNPLIVAGGGAGSSNTYCSTDRSEKHGQAGSTGANGPSSGGLGGVNGSGGTAGALWYQTGAGGGLLTDGADGSYANSGGTSFLNGGTASTKWPVGGFGGGGSGENYCIGGAGGGYSGGGSGTDQGVSPGAGGGGGSYNSGTNQSNTSGVNSGHGKVIISWTPSNPCVLTNTFTVPMLPAIFINAGANLTNTYYWGLSAAMRVIANPSGGTGPYTYSWTSKEGYTVKSSFKQIARLWYPTGPTWMICEITDQGEGCTIKDSIYIDWFDLHCGPAGQIWFYEMCDDGVTVCVHTSFAMRAAVLNGATFGPCALEKNDNLIGHDPLVLSVFPNPAQSELNLIVNSPSNEVMDLKLIHLNGLSVWNRSVSVKSGLNTLIVDPGNIPSGMYILYVNGANEAATLKVLIE